MAQPPRHSVLFVCMGNICRSPAAEAVFRQAIEDRKLSSIFRIESAGTHGYHVGNLPDPRMRRAAAQRGYQLTSRARQISAADCGEFQLIVAMDHDNLRIIQGLEGSGQSEIRLLSQFLAGTWPDEVPDPYYGGAQGFDTVLDMVQAACPAIIEYFVDRA